MQERMLHSLSPLAYQALVEHVARLKHDLGKYVALQQRWLPEDASVADRLRAFEADVLATRRGAQRVDDAWTVWSELRPVLVGEVDLVDGERVDLTTDPDVERLDAAMEALLEVIAQVQADSKDALVVQRGLDAAIWVSDACRVLYARVRRREV